MRILAIETSCDETGIAIVDGSVVDGGFEFEVLANVLHSQASMHSEYGGVYPALAKREHLKNLPILLEKVLADMPEKSAKEVFDKIDAIAVTNGPGLEPALWTGITFAESLAREWNKPILGVNHLEGHLMAAFAKDESPTKSVIKDIKFPFLGLIVSGGHTEFVVSSDWFVYEKIGETVDDAVGEAFDKVARMLGLSYPGGPEISRLASEARSRCDVSKIVLPRPMLHSKSCDVSFSGLKTAVLYALRNIGGVETLSPEEKASFAREFEDSVAEVFVSKTRRALDETQAQTFAIGGGVSANIHIRNTLSALVRDEFNGVEVRATKPSCAGDNAVMIAQAGLARLLSGNTELVQQINSTALHADGNLSLDGK